MAAVMEGPSHRLAEPGGPPAMVTLTRELQMKFLLQLLSQRGEVAANMIRDKTKSGKGVNVRGLHFDADVLQEALGHWMQGPASAPTPAPASVPAPTLSRATPVAPPGPPARTAPAGPPGPPARSASAGPTGPPAHTAPAGPGRRNPRLSGAAATERRADPGPAAVAAATARPKRKSLAPDENVDPQAMAAMGRAARLKAHRAEPEPAAPPAQPVTPARSVPPAQQAVPPAPPAPSRPPPTASSGDTSRTVRELKTLLAESGVDFSSCVEKADLEALWFRYEELRARPLKELLEMCATSGGPRTGSADECARFLASPSAAAALSAPSSSAASRVPTEANGAAPVTTEEESNREREREAMREVARIVPMRREAYPNAAAWGFAILGVTTRDVAAVQRSYRTLMRKLHPDRVGSSPGVLRAVEMIREAKESLERSLSKQEPPGAPRGLTATTLCSAPGRRQFKLQWLPPEEREAAPVRRYLVAAVDPAYGRALTITVLEPDYCEQLRRFVSVDELNSYVLAEEELQKMPSLWVQHSASIQVAAANDAGQSAWTPLIVPLTAPRVPTLGLRLRGPSLGVPPAPAADDSVDEHNFGQQVQRRRGVELRTWLDKQKKVLLVSWLKSVMASTVGTKEDLIESIILIVDGPASKKRRQW